MTQLTSTKLLFDQTTSLIGQAQGRLAEIQTQIASGQKHNSFDDFVSDISRLKGLQSTQARLNSYTSSITRVNTRLTAVDDSLGQLIDVASELRDNISLRRTPSGSSLDLEELAKNSLQIAKQLLNTRIDGTYVFAGSKTNTAPIRDNIDIVANYNASDADPFITNSNYYLGDGVAASLRVSDSREIEYGITADETAFKDLIAAAHLAIEAHQSEDTVLFERATDYINTALSGLITLRTKNGNDLAEFQNIRDTNEQAITSLNASVAEIADTDVVQASIEVAFQQTLLQATFQSFARISQLSLTNFL